MKLRIFLLTLLAAMFLIHPLAQGFRFSVGAFGGMNLPIAQSDTKSGTAMGLKARIPIMTFIAVEPNYTYLKNGDGQVSVEDGWNTTMKREGGKFTSFGIDLAIGGVSGFKGFNAYALLGIASAKYAKKGLPDMTKGSYWLGVGFEYGITDFLSAEVRAKGLIFPYKDDAYSKGDTGSRKNGVISLGLNYFFTVGEK